MNIILYLLQFIQYQHQQICWLLNFICRYIPLKQWAFDDSHSPTYQKFKIDQLPVIKTFIKQGWQFLLEYYLWKYGKPVKPVQRRNGKTIPEDIVCPLCGAPHHYIYDNNGGHGQYQCKVCGQTFTSGEIVTTPFHLCCPHCGHTLSPKKDRKFFRVHKCINKKCPYYLRALKQVSPEDLEKDSGKYKYKLHYIYREFTVDFFRMDLNSLPKNASSLKFSKFDAHTMSLCLTLHVNLGLSLRKTSQALKDLYSISISHQQIANYCKTAAICIKPFVDNFDYKPGNTFAADETYIKIRGVKAYIWFIIDAASRSILGDAFKFNITQVIGLTNDDAVSKEFRPFKQMIERLNRTYKQSYRPTNGFDNIDGANYDLALWVAFYNFLRPHKNNGYKVLNQVDMLTKAENMPGK